MVSSATEKTFDDSVIDKSRQRPVVVMFWAPWSGPDRILKPVVRKAVEAREGRIGLTYVDVDEAAATAGRYRVLAVPTLMAFVDGKPAMRRRVGAIPRTQLDRYLDAIEETAE